MVEEGIRGGIFTLFMDMQKPTPKKMKDCETNTELSYIQYCNVNNFYVWAMSEELSVNNFEWIKDNSQFNEDFIKTYIEKRDGGYFHEVGSQYLNKSHELHNDLQFLPERLKIEKVKKLVANL